MSKKAFDKIAAGLTEAIEIARGKKTPARPHVPAEVDVRADQTHDFAQSLQNDRRRR